MPVRAVFPSEIHERIRKGYLDRLSRRVKRMRRLLAERDWSELRLECQHLGNSAGSFGFPELSEQALTVERAIPEGTVPNARMIPEAKRGAEVLFKTIDQVLLTDPDGEIPEPPAGSSPEATNS